MNKPPEFVEPAQFWTIQGVSPLDAVLALAFALSFIDSFSVAAASWGSLATFALVIIGIVVSCAMVFRRTSPVRSAGVIYACMIVRFIASPTDLIISDLAILFALWTVVAYGPLVVRVAAIVSAIIGGILLTIARIGLLSPPDLIIFFLLAESLIIIVATTGAIRRMRLDKIKTVVLDAHRAKREAERESELAVVEERNRIARDMHDVVAHTLTTVITQADGGLYAAKTNPQAAQKTLDLISHIARDALADMRAIVEYYAPAMILPRRAILSPTSTTYRRSLIKSKKLGIVQSFIRSAMPMRSPPEWARRFSVFAKKQSRTP